uniref:Riboflavin transporter n=1 Tax=Phallusia mammillata TaxID=59560 RepID=A0A6F9DTE7_9ASCI|nr:solute carrier family 52, riboflavin transporter, member 3-B [Phallusia mammillata]
MITSDTLLVHMLVLMFGSGAWIAVNGVWVELPAIVSQAPESWGLPAYLTVISQFGNLGPLIVMIMQIWFSKYYNQNAMIYSITSIGTLGCLLLCFFWNSTAYIGGVEHSVALFALWFVLSFVDCSSSVTFLPFITIFPSPFLTTYFMGEGLSGLFPSIFALAQGTGNSQCLNVSFFNETTNTTQYKIEVKYTDPRFSEAVFFGLLCIMMALCSIAFVLLNHLPIAKRLHVTPEDKYKSGFSAEEERGTAFYHSIELEDSSNSLSDNSRSKPPEPSNGNIEETPSHVVLNEQKKLSPTDYVYLLSIIFCINGLSNGILPSVSSYTALPYGEVPYHLATSLGNMANPLACFIAFFLPMHSFIGIGFMAIGSAGFASYLLFLALKSPCPVLVNETGGAVLMVLCQILFVGCASYVKVSIAQIFRHQGHKKSLVWYGGIVQAGSLTGALIMFPLVNVYYLFQSGIPCETCT